MFELGNITEAGKFFLIIAVELVLIFVAVSFLIGLITEYLPPSRIREFLSNRFKFLGYLFGAGFGALTPFCSCSTVPITAGLLQAGVPFGPTMAFLFSSPVLNPVIIALFLTLLGYKVAIIYLSVTFLSSMLMAVVLSRLHMESQVKPTFNFGGACCSARLETTEPIALETRQVLDQTCCPQTSGATEPLVTRIDLLPGNACLPEKPKIMEQLPSSGSCCSLNSDTSAKVVPQLSAGFDQRMKRAFTFAIDTFKQVFWYLLLGAGIGAFIHGFFPQELVVKVAGPGNPWSIPIAAGIGVPMYIRAETVIPISAALVQKGMGVGTVLALVIGGAGASIPEIVLLGAIFKKKLLAAFALNVLMMAIAAGYLVDRLVY